MFISCFQVQVDGATQQSSELVKVNFKKTLLLRWFVGFFFVNILSIHSLMETKASFIILFLEYFKV